MFSITNYKSEDYVTYDLHDHLKNDFHNISLKKKEQIFVCCFRIINNNLKEIKKYPILQYLLFKYPSNQTSYSNMCAFPFNKYDNKKSIQQTGKEIIKQIFDKTINSIGYIKNNNGVFLFYNIVYTDNINKIKFKSDNLWWTLIDEICNFRKLMNFPIHYSVTNLFYKNKSLIYLKNAKQENIEIPSVAYYGASRELISYIYTFGIRTSNDKKYGPYYNFTNYTEAFRTGGWTPTYKKRVMFRKSISDENGKYLQGSFIRYAIFLGKNRVILYDNKFNNPAKLNSIKTFDTDKLIDEKNTWKDKGKWTKKFDSIFIGKIKFKKLSGYFNYNTNYIVKTFDRFHALSIHLIDKNTLKSTWDPMFEDYNIK